MSSAHPSIERRFLRTSRGVVHVASAGTGFPVLLLHQTPRSWDEYRDVLPLLGGHARAIAMDTMGFGDSDALPEGEASIETWASVALEVLAILGISQAGVVGHHTGAVIAVEMAARAPERVAALVLSSCPMVDAARRKVHEGGPVIDEVVRSSDGHHLQALWERRQPFYPAGDVDLLERFVVDALKAGVMAVEGHRVVNRYRMESALGLINCPTLVIAAPDDPHAFPASFRVAAAIKGAKRVEIPGGMVPLPDQMPRSFANEVIRFLGLS